MKRLIERIAQLQNPSVVGLDSLLDYIPQHIKEEKFAQYGDTFDAAAQAILAYNKEIIDAICDIVPAVKPQAAYYEMYSWQGMWALCETVKYAQEKGMIVIMDGKRNDIGSTMQAYAKAHLGVSAVNGKELSAFGSDMLTVNGYLGSDGIEPLLERLYQAGVRQAIVSNKNDPNVKALTRDYFSRWIPLAVGEQEGVRRKPAPDTVLKVMEEWGCKPAEVLYVGDSDVDVETARNAGVDCAAVCWGFRTEDELRAAGATALFHTPEELGDYILGASTEKR